MNKIQLWITIILLCVGFTVTCSFFLYSDIYPNIVSFDHQANEIKSVKGAIVGKFKARSDYLSLITIHFNSAINNTGYANFKIKNVQDNNWYHVSTMSAKQFDTFPQFIFGFPSIELSKAESFVFEVRLIKRLPGTPGFQLDEDTPQLISHYQYPKRVLLSSFKSVLYFAVSKLKYYLAYPYFWKVLLLSCSPALLYLIYEFYLKRTRVPHYLIKVKKNLSRVLAPYLLIVIFMIMINIGSPSTPNSTIILPLKQAIIPIILWVEGICFYHLKSNHTFGTAVLFLLICLFLLFANMLANAEKAAIWSYFFLIVGAVHYFVEYLADRFKFFSDLIELVNRYNIFSIVNTFIDDRVNKFITKYEI